MSRHVFIVPVIVIVTTDDDGRARVTEVEVPEHPDSSPEARFATTTVARWVAMRPSR